jgi:acetyl esterase
MGYVVKMPKLGLEMEQGTLLDWHVAEGDTVEEGETIAEVESEKSIGEVDAREDGVLRLTDLQEGETVPPGTPIGIVAGADGDIADLEAEFDTEGASTETAETEAGADETAASSSESETAEAGAAETPSASTDVRASPKAEQRADELGVDLTTIDGTGPQGAIAADDVEAVADDTTMETELHPQAEDLLHELSDAGVPPLYRLSAEDARETYLDLTVPDGEPEPVNQILDTEALGPNGSIPVRVYDPADDGESANGPQPTLVFFHGGGWVIGDITTHDLACRALANAAGCVIASVAYRRAPENSFPAALEDCYAATAWLADNPELDGVEIDVSQIVVGGDSAGGTLATGVALAARDRGGPNLAHQLLVYPATNHGFDTESYTENANGYFIARDDMERFWDDYLETPRDGQHPYASPLGTADLAGLPSATVLTAGFDPLRDEGREYADQLEEAGVPVTRFEYDDMIHGFLTFLNDPEWDRAREAIDDLAGELRTTFEK